MCWLLKLMSIPGLLRVDRTYVFPVSGQVQCCDTIILAVIYVLLNEGSIQSSPL